MKYVKTDRGYRAENGMEIVRVEYRCDGSRMSDPVWRVRYDDDDFPFHLDTLREAKEVIETGRMGYYLSPDFKRKEAEEIESARVFAGEMDANLTKASERLKNG